MLLLDDHTIVLAASDVTDFVACGHLAGQKLATARGERGKPRKAEDPHLELMRRRGDTHEREQMQRLSEACGGHVDLSSDEDPLGSLVDLERANGATADAMRAGAPLIYQATLFDGRWQGRADFLRRIEAPSALGDHAYEVVDTKLARRVKPAFVHQLSLYARLTGAVQGLELPIAYLLLGTGEEVRVDLRRYAALNRRVLARLERLVAEPTPSTMPEPVPHCSICSLGAECDQQLRAVDHLSLVANARRDQREKLIGAGVQTLAELAAAPEDLRVPRLGAERVELLRGQAGLQVRTRETRERTHRHLQPARARGYARLPAPDHGDLFFDLEGDPYAGPDNGLEYLWGWCDTDDRYEHAWAHDVETERAALERFVDFVSERRRAHPGMRVYHYASHEASSLQSLALKHATREDEVDVLLREHVLVDLHAVVRQGLQVGEESYSLKRLEAHHDFQRLERSVREGGGSIVAYERWLADGATELLEAIRAYNEDDCRSTRSLRDWLVRRMRPAASEQFGVDFAELAEPAPEPGSTDLPKWLEEITPILEELLAGLAQGPVDDDPNAAERRLLAHLLRYHQREGKPQYWRYFELLRMTPVELEDERDAIGSITLDETIPPEPVARSLRYAYRFPPQEFRLKLGPVVDPTTEEGHTLARVTDTHVFLKRASTKPPPVPSALIAGRPPDPAVLRQQIGEIARSVLRGDGRFPAVRSILRRERPLLDAALLGEDVDTLIAATLALRDSHLAIQGPPGTGKTFRAARMVIAALAAGLRVAITAPSHAATQNLLAAIECHAAHRGIDFAGVYKGDGYESEHGLVTTASSNKDVTAEYQLVAGTAWLLAREEHREAFDLLFADEAGQLALADTVAAGACASGIVLLGDPQQLPQVTQAAHPGGAGASALEHLLDGADTVTRGRGVLLTETWRMHPDVCAFISERSYEGRLHSRDECSRRRVDAPGPLSGAGLRTLEVEHEGCSQSSEAEAEAIAAACRALLDGGTVTDTDGETRPLRPDDVMVVAPYNLAVRCIAERVPDGVRVGTVDRFQGQESPVVFFAMTCSTAHDVPRGLDFLFSRNRLNVAISRAQCLAVLVHSPALLDAECRTIETMELVDGPCRLVELADVQQISRV
jgi:predicted RecB family nuclease